MDFENVELRTDGGIGYVTINRPKVMNALNRETVREIRSAVSSMNEDPEVSVIILTGAGEKAFAAGADIAELAELDGISGKELAESGQEAFSFIESAPKVTIAAVNGFALGGGCELAMACTIRIASENAKFGQPEVNLGIIPGYGGTQRLARLVGKGRAMELILTGRMINAEEALRIGLVSRVTKPEELMAEAKDLASKLAEKGPLALSAAKEAVDRGCEMGLREALSLEAALFSGLCATSDMKEGMKAFLEKRKAQFQRR